jgi:putative regulator of septum formation
MGWGIRILIIAMIVVGAFILRDRLSSRPTALNVGDCFDDPATTAEITNPQRHPCTEAHTAEVVYIGKMSGDDATYPDDAVVDAWVTENCVPAWSTYTGKTYETEEVLDLDFYKPTTEGWAHGGRDVVCFAIRVDRDPMTSSLKASQ